MPDNILSEDEIYEKNQEYMREKLKSTNRPEPKDPPRKINKLTCCLPIIFILIMAGAVLFYFVSNVQSAVREDVKKKFEIIKQNIPDAKDELKKSFLHGEALYTETKTNIDTATDTYKDTKELIDDVQQFVK